LSLRHAGFFAPKTLQNCEAAAIGPSSHGGTACSSTGELLVSYLTISGLASHAQTELR